MNRPILAILAAATALTLTACTVDAPAAITPTTTPTVVTTTLTPEAAFLAQVRYIDSLRHVDADTIADAGDAVCKLLDADMTARDAVDAVHDNAGLSMADSSAFVGAAIDTICAVQS